MKTFVLVYLAIIVAALYGWVVNLIAVIHLATADAPLTTMGIVRIVGIPLAGLGAILGWL
ncbi:MAG: hypothetical protein EOR00_09435 [Mesorhizobium sp.]|uniref:hypothetical protein n=1 Tax=Mesorhizobium sp. TaxID=1871066 RepID=UPI000FE5B853|nr:hypothetical protein [Mesorhizobium sp.]RWP18850.1 MAG: hypothetical protein EOR00_09435 [Mesorhizobium sp.]